MAKKPDKRKRDDPEQSRRFEETARGVEASEASDAFERTFAALDIKEPGSNSVRRAVKNRAPGSS